jgi:cobalt-zinc-cadmium efflux system outer membrane protein
LRQEAASEVALAAQRLHAAQQRFANLRDVIIPLRQRIVEQSQRHYNGMLIGIFELLEAKQDEIRAGEDYVAAQRDYWIARAQLERATGGRLRLSAGPATRTTAPAGSPATAPAAPAQSGHEHHHH